MHKISLFFCFIVSAVISISCILSTNNTANSQLHRIEYSQLNNYSKKQVDCLAKNIYREAVGESQEGWYAVGFVTMNRVNSGKFPTNVCDVVYQKTGKTFQFSWVGTKKRLTKIDDTIYNEILKIATLIYLNSDKLNDNTNGATFYHATYVKPKWRNLERTNQIGQHVFYKQEI